MKATSQTRPPIRVLIVEDDRVTARRLEDLIRREPAFELAGSANNLKNAEKLLTLETVEVVLFDLVLQRVERSQKITDLKKLAPNATFLVLTAYEEPDRIFRALCAGADGYLLKSDHSRPLAQSILEAIEFGSSFSPAVSHLVARHFHQIGQENQRAGFDQLTAQEQKVLHHLCEGYQTKEIAAKVDSAPSTIRNQIEAICKKLRAKNRVQAAVRFRLRPTWLLGSKRK